MIIGSNGCGKSTLLKIFARLLAPMDGKVLLDLFLDEPTTYLDITYQVQILDLLTELNQRKKTIIVMALHDINLSAGYADYLFALRDGKLVAEGRPEDVISEERIREIFRLPCVVTKDPVSGSPFIVPKGKIKTDNGAAHR